MISLVASAKEFVCVEFGPERAECIMDRVLAQLSCGCLDLILATRKKLEDEPLIEVLVALGNRNIK